MRGFAVTLAAAGLVLTGCSGDDGAKTKAADSGSQGGGLVEVLGSLSAKGSAARYLEYGDMAHWRAIGAANDAGATGDRRWVSAMGVGLGNIALRADVVTQQTGINVYKVDRVVAYGMPPENALRLEGAFAVDDIKSKLTTLGAKPRTMGGQEGLTFTKDNQIDMNGPMVKIGLMNQLNQVVVTDKALVAGAAAAPVEAGLASSGSLKDSADHTAVASCLGDVAAALIAAPPQVAGVKLYGLGLRKPAAPGDPAVNVVCALPLVPEIKNNFTSKFTPQAKVLRDAVDGIEHDEVSAGGQTVLRATVKIKPDGPAILVQQLFLRNQLASLIDPAAPVDPAGAVMPGS
ncbi:hypothetical protein [Sinosporangium siamense]|nr:hypothetical protein [Sinosporangium siamense]